MYEKCDMISGFAGGKLSHELTRRLSVSLVRLVKYSDTFMPTGTFHHLKLENENETDIRILHALILNTVCFYLSIAL